MRIIQIVSGGRLIVAHLVLTTNQAVQLQQLRNPQSLKKVVVEIAQDQNNLATLVSTLRSCNIGENDFIGFRICDERLATTILDGDSDEMELVASGEVVIVPFRVRRSQISFDLDALGLFADNRGRLQIQKVAGNNLKK